MEAQIWNHEASDAAISSRKKTGNDSDALKTSIQMFRYELPPHYGRLYRSDEPT
jgi:hypothetical protein